jgi:hypothetical protein
MRWLAACAAIVFGACASSVGVVDAGLLAVHGVTIGSPRSVVLAAFGNPLRIETGYDDVMDSGAWERFIYDGLLVEVIRPEHSATSRNEPYAAVVEISGPGWVTVTGLRVGSSQAQVARILGKPHRVEGEAYFYYTKRFDGHVRVQFRGDVVQEIEIDEDWT